MSAERLAAATRATYLVFTVLGFAMASWASCIPQVKARLGLSAAALGVVLLAIAAGSTVALPLSGRVVTRIGSRRTVAGAGVLTGIAIVVVAIGSAGSVALVFVGLLALGFATGHWDVAMNVHGAAVERRAGRSVMARFHAGFSVGTVAGALVGAGLIALGVSAGVHLLVVGVLVGAVIPAGVAGFVTDRSEPVDALGPAPRFVWHERRTLLIGVFVLAFALAEGTGNDWISVSVIGARHVRPALATLAYALFLAAMTGGRWLGPALLDRYGRVAVVRALALVTVAGLLLFVFGGSLTFSFLGAVLWGVGASLGFPVGMSAAADDPARAPARVSVVSSIGYLGFLVGPPIIGLLGQGVGVTHALSIDIALLIPAVVVAVALRPIGRGVDVSHEGTDGQ